MNKSSSKSPNYRKNENSQYNNLNFSNKKDYIIERKNNDFNKCDSQENLNYIKDFNLNISSNANKFNNKKFLNFYDIKNKFNERKFQSLKSIYNNETNYFSNENFLNGSIFSNNNKKKLKERKNYLIYEKEGKNKNDINKFNFKTNRQIKIENKKLKKNLSPDPYLINMIATKYLFDYKPTPSANKEKYYSPKINFYTPNGLQIYEEEKQNINLKLFKKNNDFNTLSSLNDNPFNSQNKDNFYIYDDMKIDDIMEPNTLDCEKFKYFKK